MKNEPLEMLTEICDWLGEDWAKEDMIIKARKVIAREECMNDLELEQVAKAYAAVKGNAISFTPEQLAMLQADPWKKGYCDGVQRRECKSPWANLGYKAIIRNTKYLTGYMAGEAAADKLGIKSN